MAVSAADSKLPRASLRTRRRCYSSCRWLSVLVPAVALAAMFLTQPTEVRVGSPSFLSSPIEPSFGRMQAESVSRMVQTTWLS